MLAVVLALETCFLSRLRTTNWPNQLATKKNHELFIIHSTSQTHRLVPDACAPAGWAEPICYECFLNEPECTCFGGFVSARPYPEPAW